MSVLNKLVEAIIKEKINWHAVTSNYWGRVIMAFIKGCCASQPFFEGVNKHVNSGPCGFPKGFQKGSHQWCLKKFREKVPTWIKSA